MSSEVFEGSEDSSERLEGSLVAGSVILNGVPEGSGFHLWSLRTGQWREDGSGEWAWHLRRGTEWVRTLGVNPCVSESLSFLLPNPWFRRSVPSWRTEGSCTACCAHPCASTW